MDPETQEQQAEVESVADSIRAAIAEVENVEPADEQPAEEAEAEVVEEVAEEAPETEEAPELPLKAREKPEEREEAEKALEEEVEEVVLAPASWSKEEREVFGKLDGDAQKIIAKRQADIDSEARKAARDDGREFGPLREAVGEFKDYFQQVGTTADVAFKTLIATERTLRFGTPAQKAAELQNIAQAYGIEMPAGQANGQDQDAYVDPDLAALESKFTERLSKIEATAQSQLASFEKAHVAEAENAAARFFDKLGSMDEKEHPEARYVEEVLPRFMSLVQSEASNAASGPPSLERLQALYSDAAWATPTVRDKMQQDIAARDKAESKTVRKVVRKQSSSASGGTGVSVHSEVPDINESVEDSVKRSMIELERQAGSLR